MLTVCNAADDSLIYLQYWPFCIEIKDLHFFCCRLHCTLCSEFHTYQSLIWANYNVVITVQFEDFFLLWGLYFPLSSFSILFLSFKVFSFVPLSVCGFLSLTDCFWIEAPKYIYFLIKILEFIWVFCTQSLCSLQWMCPCIEMKIKFKCVFCFGWNALCHYYILVFILPVIFRGCDKLHISCKKCILLSS